MPSTDIVPYHMGAKVTPAFHSVELDPECLELLLKEDPSIKAYKLDLAYILVKHICSSNEEVLPGWTGFNTMLCKNEIPDVSRVGYLQLLMHLQQNTQPSTQSSHGAKRLLINWS